MMRHLLRRGGGFEALDVPGASHRPGGDAGGGRIRCPKCAWQPARDHKWVCACRHEWNTFETGGVCPACQQQWRDTQCPRCDSWSPHLAWYVDDSGAGPS